MSKIKLREAFKFLSGEALAGSPAEFLPVAPIAFLCFFATPRPPLLRAAVQFVR
jgi:hypothetical protein